MRHLYLHVPFCQRRCSYCDFSIAVRKRIPAREYVDAVLRELAVVRAADPGREPGDFGGECLETLYLGGGTPSLLPPEAISALLTSLLDAFRATSLRDAVEVTIEANPEDVTLEHASAWRRAGVNRVSLGAQSFDDGVLKWMHRSHDATRIGDAVRALRAAGFDNISLDLIFALPAELRRDWARDRCAFVRRPGASLESARVGDLSARRRRRTAGGRGRGGPDRGATGTRAPVSRVAHRPGVASCRPLPPSAALYRPMRGAGMGGDQGAAASVHARGLAPTRRPHP